MTDDVRTPTLPAVRSHRSPNRLDAVRRVLPIVLGVLIGFILVEVMFEAWIQTIMATGHVDEHNNMVLDLPSWPKQVKNAAFLLLLVLTAAKVALDRSWRTFATGADLVLLLLGLAMVVTGLLNAVPPVLIGKALYIYFRGAILFLAWRAWNPPWHHAKKVFWVAGTIIGGNALIAIVQMIVGERGYTALGWTDLTWAGINRAHALFDHPNNLGHVLGLFVLGLLAWFVSRPKVKLRWWVLFAVLVTGFAASQSRESIIGVGCGIVLIAVLRRGRYKAVMASLAILVVCAALPLVASADSRNELARRLRGVEAAVNVPSGTEHIGVAEQPEQQVPEREIRVLFAQQGFRLWKGKPVLGYGVGEFGGIVAYENNPNWNEDSRFGPDGFNLYGFYVKQVDSFWLHLIVEVGAVGFLLYLAWLYLLSRPALRKARAIRRGRESSVPSVQLFSYWVPATVLFGALVAFLSPALEDPLFPALMFSVIGLGWVQLRRDTQPDPDDTGISAEPAGRESSTTTT